MRKKVLLSTCILLILSLLLGLVGCGERAPQSPDTTDDYVASRCVVQFSDDNMEKVNMKRTFNEKTYMQNATANDLQVYQIFGSGMCLQRDCVNRIWGKTTADNVCIIFNGKSYYGSVSEDNWEVYLPKMTAGGPYEFIVASDKGRITFTDVYVGEVYLLSGQSNMEWRTIWSASTMEELYSDAKACKNEQIRMLTVAVNPQPQPTTKVYEELKWDYARSNTVRTFSAIGYIFGKQLQEQLDCPVGLISTAVGGSILEYWLPDYAYEQLKQKVNVVTDANNSLFTPCLGYNGIIYPLLGYNFRGVLWYQGESNTLGTEAKYDIALEKLIEAWRREFSNQNMTFTVFQLARYYERPLAYSVVNERIEATAQRDPLVVSVLNLDLGDWNDAHPRDKRELATRAADVTLATFYAFDKATPPKIVSYEKVDDTTVVITLDKQVELRGANGFEVFTQTGYSFNCTVTLSQGKVLTITSEQPFTGLRYGYRCVFSQQITEDVSKMVCVYGINGLPLNLFTLNFTD